MALCARADSDVRLPPFAFEIGTPGRVLRFRAPTADALRAWVDALAFLLSAQCYRRAFQVLHAGRLLLRCGGSLADLFFKSFETRSALLCPRFLLVFDTQVRYFCQ